MELGSSRVSVMAVTLWAVRTSASGFLGQVSIG
jgi:hypothetical protein